MLQQGFMILRKNMAQLDPPNPQTPWKVGDRVKVDCSLELIEELQDGHGGWGNGMEEALTTIGIVSDIDEDGDVEVSYPSGSRWTFNPAIIKACLPKQVPSFPARSLSTNKKPIPTPRSPTVVTGNLEHWKTGDRVKITLDQKSLKKLQLGHGGWEDNMQEALESVGIVSQYDEDGDVEVSYPSGNRWKFNPKVLTSFNTVSSAESIINRKVSTTDSEQMNETQISKWKIGTFVEIKLELDIVHALQTGYEWEDGMEEALSSIGEVVGFDGPTGGLIVLYDNYKRWLFNPQVFVIAEGYSDDDSGNSLDCKKCLKNQRQIIFLPCYHLTLCLDCANEVKRCFLCRKTVESSDQLENSECHVCTDKAIGVLFKPCNHAAACIGCSNKMKRCIVCKQAISERITLSECEDEETKQKKLLESLQKQVEDLNDKTTCSVCLDHKIKVVFKPCGHSLCQHCSSQLQSCPICRKKIEDKIKFFL